MNKLSLEEIQLEFPLIENELSKRVLGGSGYGNDDWPPGDGPKDIDFDNDGIIFPEDSDNPVDVPDPLEEPIDNPDPELPDELDNVDYPDNDQDSDDRGDEEDDYGDQDPDNDHEDSEDQDRDDEDNRDSNGTGSDGQNNQNQLENLPSVIPGQLSNTCVPAIMEYLSSFYGNTTNQGVFMMAANTSFGVNLLDQSTGLSPDQAKSLLGQFFTTATFTSVPAAIDAGNPVMAWYNTGNVLDDKSIEYHNVLIVGYNSEDGTVDYIDTVLQQQLTRDLADFDPNYCVEVRGMR